MDNHYEPKLLPFPPYRPCEVSMPVGDGQIVGLQRFWFNGNALNGRLCTVFGKQPASRFQIFRFNPFAVRIKRVDAVGNEGLYFTEAV